MRGRLDDELGLQPGQELRDLEAAILRHDERLAPPSAVDSPPAPEQPRADAPERKRLDRRTVLWAALVAVAVIAAAVAVVLLRGDPASIMVPPNSVGVIDTAANRVVATVPVGIRPGPVAYGWAPPRWRLD